MKKFPVLIRSGSALCLLLIFSLVSAAAAAAQTAVAKVVVTSVNSTDAFPDVSVQIKVLDSGDAFIPGLDASQFTITEDGQPVTVSDAQGASLPLHLRIVFVIDELAITAHFPDVRDAILSFAKNTMLPGDSIEVLAAASGSHTRVVVPLTSDPSAVENGLQQTSYDPVAASGTDFLGAVQQGLTDLGTLNASTEGHNQVVAFSVSVQDQRNLKATIAQALQVQAPVHTVLLGDSDAAGALGRLAHDSQAGSGVATIADLSDLLPKLSDQTSQDQYLVKYHSNVDKAGDHQLLVQVGGIASGTVTFNVSDLSLTSQGSQACPDLVSKFVPPLCSNWNLIVKIFLVLVAVGFVLILGIILIFMRRRSKSRGKSKTRPQAAAPGRLETRLVDGGIGSALASLSVVEGPSGTKEKQFPLNGTTTLGRSSEHSQLAFQSDIDGSPISRLHCTLLEKQGSFEVRDEGSSNGTFVNGSRLKPGQTKELNEGDTIELAKLDQGGLKFAFHVVASAGAVATRIMPKQGNDATAQKKDGYTPTKPMN